MILKSFTEVKTADFSSPENAEGENNPLQWFYPCYTLC
jgi:hypothetical protein